MAKNANAVLNAIMAFAEGNSRNRVFIDPDIPTKKLVNARSKYITRDEPIIVLVDDTLFGSAKDGLAISENYVYAKGTLGDIKSVKLSSIRSISSQSNKLGSLDIYFGGNLFITLSTVDTEDHDFVIGILKAAYAASKSVDNSAPAKVKKPSKPVAAEPKPKNSNLAKETVACSECSANLPAGAKFCLECGAKVLPKGVCLECKAKLPEKAKFCSECGTPSGKVPAKPISSALQISDSHEPIDIAKYNNNVNVQKFLLKYKEFGRPAGQLDEELILLGFGTKGFSITQEDYDGESQEDEWFRDLLCDTILTLKMEVGEIRVLGPCEVRCVFVQQISQRNENDVTEVVNFYIVEFQCDTILLAIYGWYDEQEFLSEYSKIISSEGVHRTSYTGYLSEMTEDLQAIDRIENENGEDKEGQNDDFDKNILVDIFRDSENTINEKGIFVDITSSYGSEFLYFVFDVKFDKEGIWEFIGRLVVDKKFVLSDEDKAFIVDYMESVADDLYDTFEKFGLDPQLMGDYAVEVVAEPTEVPPTEDTDSSSIEALNKDETVQTHLSYVEDTLLEKGTLVSLIGGGDPEVSIKFEHINPYDMDSAANYMVIFVTEDDFDADDVDDDDAEEFGDNVHQKVSEFASDWESSLREMFENLEGVVVRINGQYRG